MSHSSQAFPIRNVMVNSNVLYPSPHLLPEERIICVVIFLGVFMFNMFTVVHEIIEEKNCTFHLKETRW